jgi:hypothetical protein
MSFDTVRCRAARTSFSKVPWRPCAREQLPRGLGEGASKRGILSPRGGVVLTAKLNKLTIKLDRPRLSLADIKKFEGAMKAAADGPLGDDLSVLQRIELGMDKTED